MVTEVMNNLTSPRAELAVVDLDGTLITGNSLHEYIRCGLRQAIAGFRIAAACRIAATLAARKLHLISHLTMKNHLLRVILPTPALRARFERRIKNMMSDTTVALLDQLRCEGCEILLATAASEIYVPWIWQGRYIATPPLSADECRGEVKRSRALDYAMRHNMVITTAVTDHSDDCPLLAIESASCKIVISPTPRSLARIRAAGIEPSAILSHHGRAYCAD